MGKKNEVFFLLNKRRYGVLICNYPQRSKTWSSIWRLSSFPYFPFFFPPPASSFPFSPLSSQPLNLIMTLLWRSQVLILRMCVFVSVCAHAFNGGSVNKKWGCFPTWLLDREVCVLPELFVCVRVLLTIGSVIYFGGLRPRNPHLPPPTHLPCIRQLGVPPLGTLKRQSCPLCPHVFLLHCVWKIRPFCSCACVCVCVCLLMWACVSPR